MNKIGHPFIRIDIKIFVFIHLRQPTYIWTQTGGISVQAA